MRERLAEAAVKLFFREDERDRRSYWPTSASTSSGPAFAHDPAAPMNVGIMEQALVGVAAGFALEGFRPVVHTIAPVPRRARARAGEGRLRLPAARRIFSRRGASYDYAHSGMTHRSPGDVRRCRRCPACAPLVPGHAAEVSRARPRRRSRTVTSYLRTTSARTRRRASSTGGGPDGGAPRHGAYGHRGSARCSTGTGGGRRPDPTVLYATTVYPLNSKCSASTPLRTPTFVLRPNRCTKARRRRR